MHIMPVVLHPGVWRCGRRWPRAIPRLARLSLRVTFNYHTPMPEVAPMTELNHLGLWLHTFMLLLI
jgi:hypothetical protein